MAIVLAAAVSLPALFVADGYVSADYTVDQRAQESSSRLVAKKDVNSSALLAEQLYVVDGYYANGYTDDPRRAEGYALIPATLVKDQDTIGIFPTSSTLAGPGLTQTAGAQADATSSSLSASFRIESTGMAASATSTTIMPFGMLEDAAAVSSQNKNAKEQYVADLSQLPQLIVDASVGTEPQQTLLNVVQDGRKVGDVSGNGQVQAFDASLYSSYLQDLLTDQSQVDFIRNVLNPYFLSDMSQFFYVEDGYVESESDVFTSSFAAAEIIRNGHFIPVASSATDIAVTQVRTVGAASEAVTTHITAGSRIESTGMLSSATSTTLIPTTRVASTGYKSDATSATDIGSASIKSVGAQSRSGIGTTRVSDLILKAAVNAEPERTLLNTTVTIVISGVETNVKVGDITRNGTVSAFDSAKYTEYLAGSLTDADMLDHIENVLHPWLTANAPDLLLESYSLIAGNFTAGFGAQIESQSTTPTAGEITASFGVKIEGDATTIIASRLKWEPVEEPTDIWTTINDDSYPFG